MNSRLLHPALLLALALSCVACGPMVLPPAAPAPTLPGQAPRATTPAQGQGDFGSMGPARPGRPVPGLEALGALASDTLGPDRLTAHFIDIGQGDALLLQTPSGRTLLVDSGPSSGRKRLVRYLESVGVRRIDVVVNTHGHADHIGGLLAVLAALPVRFILDSGFVHPSKTFEQVITEVERQRIPFKLAGLRGTRTVRLGSGPPELSAGDDAPIVSALVDEADGVRVEVLWPDTNAYIRKSRSDPNANSVVLRVTYGEVRFLLTGDAEEVTELALLERPEALKATVLKVAHHGSRHASTPGFLEAVGAKLAVISCGANNRYGHPSPETLERLEASGAAVLSTPEWGHVVVETDGTALRVSHQPRAAARRSGAARVEAPTGPTLTSRRTSAPLRDPG